MSLLDRILARDELREAPPVLVDLGASGHIHPKWRRIAKYSICVAFEPDERELGHVTDVARGFRAFHTFNRAAAERSKQRTRFHLTASPFCSSRLAPVKGSLENYVFAPLFEVERIVELPTIDVPTALGELGLDRVDWFKCDTQGTDLRLFQSLGDELVSRVLVAELEPGIIDAYEGEDKLADVMRFMASKSFWMSQLSIKGSQRIKHAIAADELSALEQRYLRVAVDSAPGWAEVEYFNEFRDDETLRKRDFLLGYVFAMLRGHEAFALELAVRGAELFGDSSFEELRRSALRRLRVRLAKLPYAIARELLDNRRAG
jgi:hypothetical protein